jgi:hypothetical protein
MLYLGIAGRVGEEIHIWRKEGNTRCTGVIFRRGFLFLRGNRGNGDRGGTVNYRGCLYR